MVYKLACVVTDADKEKNLFLYHLNLKGTVHPFEKINIFSQIFNICNTIKPNLYRRSLHFKINTFCENYGIERRYLAIQEHLMLLQSKMFYYTLTLIS